MRGELSSGYGMVAAVTEIFTMNMLARHVIARRACVCSSRRIAADGLFTDVKPGGKRFGGQTFMILISGSTLSLCWHLRFHFLPIIR